MEAFKLPETWKAREILKDFVKTHQCYEGQLSTTIPTFWRKLGSPILDIIKELENKVDE